jgi:general secretion pathway protein D
VFSTITFAEYNINLKNISLLDFVKFVSEFTNTNFVYNEKDLKGEVTIDSRLEMSTDDILEIFYSTLNLNNLVAVNKGSYIRILKNTEVRNFQDDYKKNIDKTANYEGMVTTILKLNKINARNLSLSFNKLKSKYGFVQSLKGINAIIVRDSSERIKKMIKIIKDLESDASGFEVKAIEIHNTSASNVEKGLRKFFIELKKQSLIAIDPVIISDDFSNVLIVASTKDNFKKIEYMVAQMDIAGINSTSVPRVFYLKNSSAEDVEKVLNKLLSKTDTKKNIVKFNVASDKATNSIIVVGDQMLYKKVETLIAKLDIPRKQVYVEALILETTLENGSKFGVEWIAGGGDNDNYYATAGHLVRGTDGNSNLVNFASNGPGALPGGFTLGVLGNVITFNGITFPSLGALMHAVSKLNGINILSNPQILTLDNEEAEIFVGENRPFMVSEKYDSNNNPVQTYDYRDVGVRLKITPHISSDDLVTLKIEQEVKKVTASTANVNQPITLTRKTTTKVKLKNGSTMVISGLIKDDTSLSTSSVPWLSKIPLIGWLFKYEAKGFEKTNMMVFVSVHLIESQNDADMLTGEKIIKSRKFKKEIKDRIDREFYNKKPEKNSDNKSSM